MRLLHFKGGRGGMTRDAKRPSLEAMQTLVLFAEHGELAPVAKALGLDQAVISRRLRDLREEFGLVAKQGRGIALTPTGKAAVPAFRALLRQHAQLSDWLAGRQDRPATIVVGTGGFGARFYLPAAIARFRTAHPEVRVRVHVRRGRERVIGTADGTYDLALVTHDEWQVQSLVKSAHGEAARLRQTVIAEHPFALAARRDTPAGARLDRTLQAQAVPVERLRDFDLIGPDPQSGVRRQLEAKLGPGVLRFALEAGGWDASREYARHGLGAAIVPLAVLEREDRNDLAVRRLEGVSLRDTVIDRGQEGDPAHDEFRAALTAAAGATVEEVRRRWEGILG
ncbi:MAG: LysR family transcriptional regulator [Isosphaeraceae bacterium]